MKQGVIRAIQYLFDKKEQIMQLNVVLEYKGFFGKQRLISAYMFNYFGEQLKVGDEVDFEFSYENVLSCHELEAIVKCKKKAEVKRIK
mgnify:CR=1 FL=1